MPEQQQQILIELDARGRASLGKLIIGGRRRYLGSVAEDGTITLTPAVVFPKREVQQYVDRFYIKDES